MEPDKHSLPREIFTRKRLPKLIFWGLYLVMVIILIIAGFRITAYVDDCVDQYERSGSEVAMEEYLETFRQQVEAGTADDRMRFPEAPGVFESADIYEDMYMSSLAGAGHFTYEMDEASYNTTKPVYDINADGRLVAKVAMNAVNPRTILSILTITDWEITEIEPVFTVTTNDYYIEAPSTYTVTVNGVTLAPRYRTGREVANEALRNIASYVDLPTIVEYRIEDLVNRPKIRALDADGIEHPIISDAHGNVTVDEADIWGAHVTEMPKEREDLALQMAKVWDQYASKELGGGRYGLGTVQKYLIRDSYYWEVALAYQKTLPYVTSNMLLSYSDVVVDDYVEYSEDCFSCHIAFDKKLQVVKSARQLTSSVDMTVYYVYTDDTDDGADNSHWAIADMVTKTDER